MIEKEMITCQFCLDVVNVNNIIDHWNSHIHFNGFSSDFCKLCSQTVCIDSTEDILEHYISCHKRDHRCPFCVKLIYNSDLLFYHLKANTTITYHCRNERCFFLSSDKATLKRHMLDFKHKEKNVLKEFHVNCSSNNVMRSIEEEESKFFGNEIFTKRKVPEFGNLYKWQQNKCYKVIDSNCGIYKFKSKNGSIINYKEESNKENDEVMIDSSGESYQCLEDTEDYSDNVKNNSNNRRKMKKVFSELSNESYDNRAKVKKLYNATIEEKNDKKDDFGNKIVSKYRKIKQSSSMNVSKQSRSFEIGISKKFNENSVSQDKGCLSHTLKMKSNKKSILRKKVYRKKMKLFVSKKLGNRVLKNNDREANTSGFLENVISCEIDVKEPCSAIQSSKSCFDETESNPKSVLFQIKVEDSDKIMKGKSPEFVNVNKTPISEDNNDEFNSPSKLMIKRKVINGVQQQKEVFERIDESEIFDIVEVNEDATELENVKEKINNQSDEMCIVDGKRKRKKKPFFEYDYQSKMYYKEYCNSFDLETKEPSVSEVLNSKKRSTKGSFKIEEEHEEGKISKKWQRKGSVTIDSNAVDRTFQMDYSDVVVKKLYKTKDRRSYDCLLSKLQNIRSHFVGITHIDNVRIYVCMTCQYSSKYSQFDIRKHIMRRHCGLSYTETKLVSKASRYTVDFLLCLDRNMIASINRERIMKGYAELLSDIDSDTADSPVEDRESNETSGSNEHRPMKIFCNGVSIGSQDLIATFRLDYSTRVLRKYLKELNAAECKEVKEKIEKYRQFSIGVAEKEVRKYYICMECFHTSSHCHIDIRKHILSQHCQIHKPLLIQCVIHSSKYDITKEYKLVPDRQMICAINKFRLHRNECDLMSDSENDASCSP